MSVINSEEQYTFMLMTAVINQTTIMNVRTHVNWDEVLKISDFHNILSVVYYGMIAIEKNASKECVEKFFQKYKKGILLYGEYKNAEQTIGWQFARHGIHTLLLTGTDMYSYYLKRDMGYIRSLEILVDKKDLPLVHKLMKEMDYEEKENRVGSGIVYTRTPGIKVVFYSEIPIGNKEMKRYFSGSVRKYKCKEHNKFIHCMTNEEEYLYRNGRLVEKYISGELKIRDIMDIWQYRKKIGEKFQWTGVNELLEKSELKNFVEQIEILAQLWFGEDSVQDCGIALEIEDYILSHGKENRWLDGVLLPYERCRLDFYRRDREEEWTRKRKEWRFPPKEYMMQLFPVLKKYPFLLCFFWILREFRYYKAICVRRLDSIVLKGKRKWLEWKEILKARFAKEEEE